MSFRNVCYSVLFACALISSGSQAKANTLFVATTGSDSNSCFAGTPCQSITRALSQASPGDTIFCLSPVFDGFIQINKSVNIDCSGARALILSIVVNLAPGGNINASDSISTVHLRGISMNGSANGGRSPSAGITLQFVQNVYLEDVSVSDFGAQGILDLRTNGSPELYITNSIVNNCGGPGIVAAASHGSGPLPTVVLENVRSEGNAYGVAVAVNNNVAINRSVLSGNSTAGVIGDTGAHIVVNNSTISHNGSGVISNSSVRISNSDIAFNTTAVSGSTGTFGNNRFSGNTSTGSPLTPLGAASSDVAQQ
ncbi:right-handed parallel beta-helix repeat-containing protein [Bradyrhizobium genosp. L]|uniref:right-handed parallel beta-helix repeat-containing protein n=1 Tax=Bradyrhizobium genosp. L TaxID=83637 RepID=UPI0018A2585E|nr:right-handed parallel beta-helix repeat-containing protein [Bradyrhizobium genosp. L]QPF81864.1 right-handed parallel beta-helix repeat-containing protein [Bradyrhizobium genosp. L]